MAILKIILGNKNYSSWSLRAWLVLKYTSVPFEEVVIPLDQETSAQDIRRYSPTGRVPALIDDGLVVWDSLAICEYLHERFPRRDLWPVNSRARAVARSVSAEMHSGFQRLRSVFPFRMSESLPVASIPDDVRRDIDRILEIWADCRSRFGAEGPFLFGAFSIADSMYAPVISRFRTYGVPLDGVAAAYADSVWSLPILQDWLAAARAEPWRMARYESRPP